MLTRMRDQRGEPHVGTRALAVLLVLLLAAPLTIFVWRGLVALAHVLA